MFPDDQSKIRRHLLDLARALSKAREAHEALAKILVDGPREPTANAERIVLNCLREKPGEYVAEKTLREALAAKGMKTKPSQVIARLRQGWEIESAKETGAAKAGAKGYRLHGRGIQGAT